MSTFRARFPPTRSSRLLPFRPRRGRPYAPLRATPRPLPGILGLDPLPTNSTQTSTISAPSSPDPEKVLRALSRSVIAAYMATRARSLFALKSLVELLLWAYASGLTVDTIQMEVTTCSMMYGILQPIDTEILSSWTAVVFLVLEEKGITREQLRSALLRAIITPVTTSEEPGEELPPPDHETDPPSTSRSQSTSTSLPPPTASAGERWRGLAGLVKHILKRQADGAISWASIAAEDAIEKAGSGSSRIGGSQSAELMKNNARLILLTQELAERAIANEEGPRTGADGHDHDHAPVSSTTGTSTSAPPPTLKSDVSVVVDLEPTGVCPWDAEVALVAVQRVAREVSDTCVDGTPTMTPPLPPSFSSTSGRATATGILLCYMGTVLGSSFSLRSFVSLVAFAYASGDTADDIFRRLREEDFAQTGGIVPMVIPATGPPTTTPLTPRTPDDTPRSPSSGMLASVDAPLLALWISTCYMALALLGVPRRIDPRRTPGEGWAWVTPKDVMDGGGGGGGSGNDTYGQSSTAAAAAVSNFVESVLRRLGEERERREPDESEREGRGEGGEEGGGEGGAWASDRNLAAEFSRAVAVWQARNEGGDGGDPEEARDRDGDVDLDREQRVAEHLEGAEVAHPPSMEDLRVPISDPWLEDESPTLFLMRTQAQLVEETLDQVLVMARVLEMEAGAGTNR